MSDTQVGKLLLSVGASLGRSPSAMEQFIQTIVVDGWYDTVDSLRDLNEEQWLRFQLPRRLEESLRQAISERSLPQLVPIEAATLETSSLIIRPPSNQPLEYRVEVAPTQLNDALSIPVPLLIDAIRAEIHSIVTDSPELMLTECLELVAKILGNIFTDPQNIKFRRVKKDNPKFAQFVGRWSSANDLLKACGFESDGDTIVCKTVFISRFTDVLETLSSQVHVPVMGSVFNPFKSSITNAGDTFGAPRGKLAQERDAELKAVRSEVDQLRIEMTLETGNPLEPPRIVSLDPKIVETSSIEHPNEDTSLLLANMRSLAAAGESAQKFKSRERTELEKLRARKNFTRTTVRILFADKVALDIVVAANESVEQLYAIVTSCMNEPMKRSNEWMLTVSPPLKKLSRTSKATMMQEEYVPSVVMRMMKDGNQCVSTHVLSNNYHISKK